MDPGPAPAVLAEDDYRLEAQVGFLLRKAHQAATEVFQSQAGRYQVTPTQFSTLIRLDDAARLSRSDVGKLSRNDVGELSQGDLGELTAMDPATLLGVIQRLAKRGLLAVRADPCDGRRRLVRLTAEGRALARTLRGIGARISELTLEGFSDAERRELLRLLARLGGRGS